MKRIFRGISVTLIHIENARTRNPSPIRPTKRQRPLRAFKPGIESAIAYQLRASGSNRQVSAASSQITRQRAADDAFRRAEARPFTLDDGADGREDVHPARCFPLDFRRGLLRRRRGCRSLRERGPIAGGGRDGRAAEPTRAKSSPSAQTAEDGSYAFEGVAGTHGRATSRPKKRRTAASPRRNAAWPEAAAARSDCRYARADRFRRATRSVK